MPINISVVGTIATDPAMHNFENGGHKCYFRIAVNERRRDKDTGDWIDAPTQWFTVNSYRALGANAYESFRKGQRVIVSGRLHARQWESAAGKAGTSLEIEADGLGHDLRWGVSAFTKVTGIREKQDSYFPLDSANESHNTDDILIRRAA